MLPATIDASPPAVIPPTELSERHERFVQELLTRDNMADAYLAVYPKVRREVAWVNGCRLRARSDVQKRLRLLQAVAAERALVKPERLIEELHEIATADPAELSRVVVFPCADCWTDLAFGEAIDRAIAAGADMPDEHKPRSDCTRCQGLGDRRIVLTPTHELRGAARRLYRGARMKSDGSIEVLLFDQLAARVEMHKLLGMHVSRSVSANINVPVAPSKELTAAEALAYIKSLTPA
jgi:phage terminase small subunit